MSSSNHDDDEENEQPLKIPKIQYSVRSPWAWVAARAIRDNADVADSVVGYDSPRELASSTLLLKHREEMAKAAAASKSRRSAAAAKQAIAVPPVSTLRMEMMDADNRLLEPALYGTSHAFDGLDDKDELVRTFQRCRSDHLGMSPPTELIRWDVTRDECRNMIKELPVLETNKNRSDLPVIAVLKEPMGSQGQGIYFVRSVDEAFEIVEHHRRRAIDEGPDFLDSVMDQKGRIPCWVLQAEVYPCRLINSRKFHIRSYVAGVEKLHHRDLLDVCLFRRHEVRVAGSPIDTSDSSGTRDLLAHITNGAFSESTDRQLLHQIPELKSAQRELEAFCARVFTSLWPDFVRRVSFTSRDTPYPAIRKFTLAGLDIMMAEDGRFYLLEVNVNPSAPPQEAISEDFQAHLSGLLTELMQLVLGRPSPTFVNILDIVEPEK